MIPPGITADHVRLAIRDYEAGTIEHGFKDSTKYDLLEGGRRYPSKAILGLAARYVLGEPLKPDDFKAGDSGCFRTLRKLGFRIVPKAGVVSKRFTVEGKYTRADIYKVLGVPESEQGGDWDTGYHRHKGEWFIFCTLGGAGRTGHDYPNRFEGSELVWTGRTGARADHKQIQSLVSDDSPVHVFFREKDREPFWYAGLASAVAVDAAKVPVKVRWRFDNPAQPHPGRPAEEVSDEMFPEGAAQRVTVNAYERNPAARRRCLEHYGFECVVCGFDFERAYGDLGRGYIHVHHLRPLAEIGEKYHVNPIEDLRPVCANCHAMIHARPTALSIEDVRAAVTTASGDGGSFVKEN